MRCNYSLSSVDSEQNPYSFIHLFTAYETVIMESGSISDFSVGFISVNDIILVY